MVHYRGTPYETRRCPKAVIRRTPCVYSVARIYHSTEGRLGADILKLGAPLVDAVSCIDDAAQRKR